MPSNTTQNPHLLDYSQRRPRGRRRLLWIMGTLLVLGAIGTAVACYVVVPAYSIHKRRELNIQAGILNAAPTTSKLVREWNPAAARGEQAARAGRVSSCSSSLLAREDDRAPAGRLLRVPLRPLR